MENKRGRKEKGGGINLGKRIQSRERGRKVSKDKTVKMDKKIRKEKRITEMTADETDNKRKKKRGEGREKKAKEVGREQE